MDESVFEGHQDVEEDGPYCGIFDIGGQMMITRVPGRKGKYLVLASGGTLMILARLYGVTQAQQDLAEARLLGWSAGREVT